MHSGFIKFSLITFLFFFLIGFFFNLNLVYLSLFLVFISIKFSYKLIKNFYLFSFSIIFFHSITLVFLIFYLLYFENFVIGKGFDQSVFTISNLEIANNLNSTVLVILCLVFNKKLIDKIQFGQNSFNKFRNLSFLNSFLKKKKLFLFLSLLSTFLSFIILFTNISLFDISYPRQNSLQWIPAFFRPLPFYVINFILLLSLLLKKENKFDNIIFLIRILFYLNMFFSIMVMGGRGTFLNCMFLLFIFDFFSKNHLFIKLINSSINIFVCFFLYFIWHYMRHEIHDIGLVESYFNAFYVFNTNFLGFDIDSIPLIPALIFHLLYVIELAQQNISIGIIGFFNLILQFPPSWFDGILYTRPISDGWTLSNYYWHGGGFFILANLYFYGGIIPLVISYFFIGIIAITIDEIIKNYNKLLLYFLYFSLFPIWFIQLGYGLQGFVRVIEVFFIGFLFYKITFHKKK